MEDLEPTRRSLLVRMKDLDDQTSWHDFFNKYWRLIYAVARRFGFSDAQAQDIVQETILVVCKNIQSYEYDPNRSSFHGWLMLLTRQRIYNQLRKNRRSPDTIPLEKQNNSGEFTEYYTPDPNHFELETVWNEEWRKNLIATASESVKNQVSSKQFQIYDLHVLQGLPVKQVSEALKVNVAQIYVTKHRVGKLMKAAIQNLEAG